MQLQKALVDQINFIRLGGATKRYHTKAVIKENTVAHHSFGVAWLVWLLSEPFQTSVGLVMAALAHDLAEQVTGDVSAPTKRMFPDLDAILKVIEIGELAQHELNFETGLDDDERRILKMADCMDGMLYCISELELGNQGIREIYERYSEYVQKLNPIGREWQVYSAIRILGAQYVG